MANVNVSRTIAVNASPDTVWKYIVRPERIVGCLPGATLVSSSDDGRRHEGTVSVALGPLALAYKGSADFVDVDDDAHRLKVSAKGREKTGAGMVSMTMTAEVAPRDGHSELRLEAAVQLAGKIVAFGRGMVDAVMEKVLDDFGQCLSRRLETEATHGDAAVAGDGTGERPAGRGVGTAPTVSLLRLLVRALRTRLRRFFGER